MMNLFRLARRLIDTESVTGNEKAMVDLVSELLVKYGFHVIRQPVATNRANLWATTEGPAKVVLCTHLDTVPPFFSSSEDSEFIYGRGACDVKGIIAAMLVAAQKLLDAGTRDFGLLFLVGEENDSIGARKSNELRSHSDYVVVGEPTQNMLAAGHKGMLGFTATARGRAGHSSFPQVGESAIDKLLDFLQKLRFAALPTDPMLGQPTVNIGKLKGGVAHNVIPDCATATVSIRATTETHLLLQEIQALAGDAIDLEIFTRSEPRKLVTVEGFSETVVPFCTDIPHLKNWGQALLIGPGDPRVAHTDKERIEKQALADSVIIYTKLVRNLLRQKGANSGDIVKNKPQMDDL